jgi:hypothetical protein
MSLKKLVGSCLFLLLFFTSWLWGEQLCFHHELLPQCASSDPKQWASWS